MSLHPIGELSVEATSTGKYRWVYVTIGGAMYIGPKLYASKAAAKKAGNLWVAEREGS